MHAWATQAQEKENGGGPMGAKWGWGSRYRSLGIIGTLAFDHLVLPLLRSPLMLQTGAECGWAEKSCQVLHCDEICALGHSRVLLLGELSISRL